MISGMGNLAKTLGSISENQELIARLDGPESVAKDTVLIREGGHDRECFIIKEGFVEITHSGQLLDVLGAGEIVGEMSILTGQKRSATVVCSTDCEVFRITEEAFEALAQEDMLLFSYCMQVMAARLTRMNEIASTMMRGPSPMMPQVQRPLDQKRELARAGVNPAGTGNPSEETPSARPKGPPPPKPVPKPASTPAPSRKGTERRWD